MPVAARSKAWVYNRSISEVVVSNPEGGHGCLSLVLVVSRGVIPNVIFLIVVEEPHRRGPGPVRLLSHEIKRIIKMYKLLLFKFGSVF